MTGADITLTGTIVEYTNRKKLPNSTGSFITLTGRITQKQVI